MWVQHYMYNTFFKYKFVTALQVRKSTWYEKEKYGIVARQLRFELLLYYFFSYSKKVNYPLWYKLSYP